jgi:hypothetical protein
MTNVETGETITYNSTYKAHAATRHSVSDILSIIMERLLMDLRLRLVEFFFYVTYDIEKIFLFFSTRI